MSLGNADAPVIYKSPGKYEGESRSSEEYEGGEQLCRIK
jgi:hypothetical protein